MIKGPKFEEGEKIEIETTGLNRYIGTIEEVGEEAYLLCDSRDLELGLEVGKLKILYEDIRSSCLLFAGSLPDD